MSKFEKVKKYYDSGLWNKKMVKNAVIKGWITEDEYEEIVGEPYQVLRGDTECTLTNMTKTNTTPDSRNVKLTR